mgnify:CR=1 FL=1
MWGAVLNTAGLDLIDLRLVCTEPSDYANPIGTGPFKFVEHAAGSHWVGQRFEPAHLDGVVAVLFHTSAPGLFPGRSLHLELREQTADGELPGPAIYAASCEPYHEAGLQTQANVTLVSEEVEKQARKAHG